MLPFLNKNNISKSKQKDLDESEEDKQWLSNDYREGQLAIDVYETDQSIIIKSTMAGVKPDDIDISINNDMLTIRGKREESEEVSEDNYLYKECYWGSFSRSIILPTEVDNQNIDAELENGVLTIVLDKKEPNEKVKINIKS